MPIPNMIILTSFTFINKVNQFQKSYFRSHYAISYICKPVLLSSFHVRFGHGHIPTPKGPKLTPNKPCLDDTPKLSLTQGAPESKALIPTAPNKVSDSVKEYSPEVPSSSFYSTSSETPPVTSPIKTVDQNPNFTHSTAISDSESFKTAQKALKQQPNLEGFLPKEKADILGKFFDKLNYYSKSSEDIQFCIEDNGEITVIVAKEIINEVYSMFEDSKKLNYTFKTELDDQNAFNNMKQMLIRVLFESCYHKLLAFDEGKTKVTLISDLDGKPIEVGQYMLKLKLTPLGMAYKEKLFPTISEISDNLDEQSPSTNKIDHNFSLAIIKQKNQMIPEGSYTHINVLANNIFELCLMSKDICYSIGYLTSQKGAKIISDVKFKLFQDSKLKDPEKPFENNGTKQSQGFVMYKNIKQIPSDQIVPLKWSKDYLDNLTKKKIFEDAFQILKKKPFTTLEPCITIRQLIKMCHMVQEDMLQNKPKPKSAFQIKQNQENILKMKKKNMVKNADINHEVSEDNLE